MCEELNLFIPKKKPLFGPPVQGLRFVFAGRFQKDFRARFAHQSGVFVRGEGGSSCLCGFDRWQAFYELARDLLVRNSIPWLAGIYFWTEERYELSERLIDLDDPELCTPGRFGELLVMRIKPAAQRHRHHILRALSDNIGQRVTLRLKNGRVLHGVVGSFDAESEIGTVEGEFFVAGQVLSVELSE